MAAKPQVETSIRYVCQKCQFYTDYVELINGDKDTNDAMYWITKEANDHNKEHHTKEKGKL